MVTYRRRLFPAVSFSLSQGQLFFFCYLYLGMRVLYSPTLSKYGRRIRRQGEEEGGTREMSDYRLGLFLLLLFFFLSVIDEGHMQQLGTASFTAWAHLFSGLPSRFTWEVKLSCNTVYIKESIALCLFWSREYIQWQTPFTCSLAIWHPFRNTFPPFLVLVTSLSEQLPVLLSHLWRLRFPLPLALKRYMRKRRNKSKRRPRAAFPLLVLLFQTRTMTNLYSPGGLRTKTIHEDRGW